ncbi:hypothetical protein [Stenotrophomonas maltophilia]|uniref:hypothetical protein n=1 Tax=Stenotrophomonas maltophilia TaxID=40324 RepID=UPI001E5548F1|nr:hypothetical protein [Stenotrophomonas maltophilia]MCD5965519.1 hypothetical protein [Stenotrophomonas maltophilia]
MGLSIFTLPDFVEKLIGKVKNAGRVETSEQRTVKNAKKRFKRLMGRGDKYIVTGELPNVPDDDVDKVLSMGAKLGDNGVFYVPKGLDPNDFKKWAPIIHEDLDDEHSTYKTTTDGAPWENFVAEEDITTGSDSTATAVVYGMFPILAAVTILLQALPGWWALLALAPALLVIPHFAAIKQGEDFKEALKICFYGYALPVFMAINMTTAFNASQAAPGFTKELMVGGPILSTIMFGLVAFVMSTPFVFAFSACCNYNNDQKMGGAFEAGKSLVRKWAWICVGGVIVLCLPPTLAPWVILLFVASYPMHYTENNFRARALAFDQMNKKIGGVVQSRSFARDREDKKFQALNAQKDKSPLIKLGVSTGYLSSKGYSFSPDSNNFMVVSVNDLCTHLFSFGRTGIGKSTTVARTIALQIALAAMGGYPVGMFVLCGKGTLPGELENVLNWNIKPGMAVGLIEGLNAEELALAVNTMIVGSNSREKIWEQGADNHVFQVCQIFEALCEHETTTFNKAVAELTKIDMMIPYMEHQLKQMNMGAMSGSDAHMKAVRELQQTRDRKRLYEEEVQRPREWVWSWANFIRALNLVDNIETPKGSEVGVAGPELTRWFKFLGVNVQGERAPIAVHPGLRPSGQQHLRDAVTYIMETWVPMPVEQRSSFRLNVNQRTNGLNQAKGLVDENGTPWTSLTTGVDITSVMRGSRIGIDLPEALYGSGGAAVQILLKQRVYAKLRQRVKVKNWRKEMPEETVFIQIMDECQLLVNKQEIDLLSIARSLGMGAVYLSQNIEGMMRCFDNLEALKGFLDQFQSYVCSMASEATYEFVMSKLGQANLIQYKPTGRGIDYKGAATAFKRSPLNMEDHPQRASMARMKAWGMNKVVSADMFYSDYGQRWDQKWSSLNGTNVKANANIRSAILVGGAGEMQEGPVVTLAEMGQELNTSGGARALVCLNRGNIRRVDFARTIPVTPEKVDEYMDRFKEEAGMIEELNVEVA